MRNIILLFLLPLVPALLHAQHTNVKISSFDYPEEPTICINPKNPQQVVAGSNIDHVFYSEDGGLTWQRDQMASTYGVWGDPCIIADTSGAF